MFESLIFIFLIFISAISLLTALILLLIGVFKKSTQLKIIAFGIGIIPILCYGLVSLWYYVVIPSFDKTQMKEFSGTYQVQNTNNKTEKSTDILNLSEDGTYIYTGTGDIALAKYGTWKTGGIDGVFEFYNEKGRRIEFASPSGGDGNEKITFNLYGSNQAQFVKKRLVIVYKKPSL